MRPSSSQTAKRQQSKHFRGRSESDDRFRKVCGHFSRLFKRRRLSGFKKASGKVSQLIRVGIYQFNVQFGGYSNDE